MSSQFHALARVKNRRGIHARPSAQLVDTAEKYQAEIFLTYRGFRANAKKLLDVLSMGADFEAKVMVDAEGPGAEAAGLAIKRFIESEFDYDKQPVPASKA